MTITDGPPNKTVAADAAHSGGWLRCASPAQPLWSAPQQNGGPLGSADTEDRLGRPKTL